MAEILWIGLAGAVVYLDTTAVAQLMICQPLIACPLWGLLMGRPEVGLFFGITFQLLWLGSLPVGAAKFPEGNLGALAATAIAVDFAALGALPSWIVLAFSALIGILAARLGAEVTLLVRKTMTPYAARIVSAARAGQAAQFRRLFSGAVGIHAAVGFVFTAVVYIVGRTLLQLGLNGREIPPLVNDVLAGLWPALLGIGAAVIAARLVNRRSWPGFAIPLLLILLAGWQWL